MKKLCYNSYASFVTPQGITFTLSLKFDNTGGKLTVDLALGDVKLSNTYHYRFHQLTLARKQFDEFVDCGDKHDLAQLLLSAK